MVRRVANSNSSGEDGAPPTDWVTDWLAGRDSIRNDSFEVVAGWGVRKEEPEACVARMLRTLDSLASVHPVFSRLKWAGAGVPVPTRDIQSLRELNRLEQLFRRKRACDRERQRLVEDGYLFAALGRLDRTRTMRLTVRVGRHAILPDQARFPNTVSFAFETLGNPDYGGMPFEALRVILEALTAAWEPEWCAGISTKCRTRMLAETDPSSFYDGCWIIHLAQPLASQIVAPPSVLVDHRPDGSLLMRATDQPFEAESTSHFLAAVAIATALEPLESLQRGY